MMIVGGVEVGCGKGLKFPALPNTKYIKILEIKRKYVEVEFYMGDEKKIHKCYKDRLTTLISYPMVINGIYNCNRLKFIDTICF